MYVQMIHCLPPVLPRIDDDPKSLSQPMRRGLFRCHRKQMPQQSCVLARGVRERHEMQAGDDQQVNRSLRRDVRERQHLLVLKDSGNRNLSVCDPAKKACHTVSIVQAALTKL